MKTFSQFQSNIQEKAGLIKTAAKVGKRVVQIMGKKFNRIGKSMGKTTIPGTDIKMPFGMNRGEYAAIQTGITGIVGKKN